MRCSPAALGTVSAPQGFALPQYLTPRVGVRQCKRRVPGTLSGSIIGAIDRSAWRVTLPAISVVL